MRTAWEFIMKNQDNISESIISGTRPKAPAAPKTALILEGGAMRGLFSAGIMDILMENGIEFDGIAGISAGAVFGCNYKSRQIGRVIRYNKRFCRDKRYCSVWSLIHTGDLYGADFCYRELPDELDIFDTETFEKNPVKFYVGATDIHTGKAVYHLCTDGGREDLAWMRASASMPIVSRPVKIMKRGGDVDTDLSDPATMYELLDGGVADSVPYSFMEDHGYSKNIIVLTQPAGYRKKKSSGAALLKLMLRKYPKIADAMEHRSEMYNRQMNEIEEREAAGASLVIRPEAPLGIGRTEKNPDELERVYQLGRAEGERRLPEIRRFLA